MEQQRNFVFLILLALTLLIFWNWESDQANAARQAAIAAAAPAASTDPAAPLTDNLAGSRVHLVSDALDLTLDLNGGDVVGARLLKIKQEQDRPDPFQLLMNDPGFTYIAQSGLAGPDGPDSRARPIYTSAREQYALAPGESEISAALQCEQDDVTYTKTYTLHRSPAADAEDEKDLAYVVDLRYDIVNRSDRDRSLCLYGQLKQTEDDAFLREQKSFAMVASAYRGTAYSAADARYEKATLKDLIGKAEDQEPLHVTTPGGWVAMIQHYFVSAWIGATADGRDNVIYSSKSRDSRDAIIGIRTDTVTVPAGGTVTLQAQLWVGPKNQDQMNAVAPNLGLTVDYGWLWFISIPLFRILQFIQSLVTNWGLAIIILTLVVRGVMFPLTKAQYTSMAKMRLLTPKMQELRERYKDDRQKLGQETMRMYRAEKVNPLGGCLPLVIQMPIFIALYWTLMESTELRQSSFIFWIKDLSVYDPFFVLPILYGISMFLLQKMSPTPITDPIQRKVFLAMPLVFTFMFCTFPAGLTLYWLVSNCFTIFQQTIIFRSLEKRGLSMRQPAKPAPEKTAGSK